MQTEFIIALIALFLIIALFVWFLQNNQKTIRSLNSEILEVTAKSSALENDIKHSNLQVDSLKEENTTLRNKLEEFTIKLSQIQVEKQHLEKNFADKETELQKLHEQLKLEFKQLSQEIMDQNSRKLSLASKEELSKIVDPLKENLKQYNHLINDFREKDIKERSNLSNELKNLKELNIQLSDEARNLTNALKSDTKLQGNWGEMILERVLEKSGMHKGVEYETQHSTTNPDGKRIQPDVVVFLPENKHLIIDSKVSLVAWENMVNADDAKQEETALKAHVASVRNHIKGLATKDYSGGKTLNSPEFIFLFMPMENALHVALYADPELQNFAWDHRIVLVTPATLMATLMTVANLWKLEKQNQFAEKIASETGLLYDKFILLLESVKDVGRKIDSLQGSHKQLIGRLVDGPGNLISKSEKIRNMGIPTKKQLPPDFQINNQE